MMTQPVTQPSSAPPVPAQDLSRFRLFVEMMPHLAWMSSAGGAVDYANRRWCEYTGLQAGGPSPFEAPIVHRDDLELAGGMWRRALDATEPLSVECRLRRAADGNFRWHLCRAVPMRDDDGRLVGWCGTCADIDVRIRAADSLSNMERFLESIIDNIPEAVFVKAAADLRFVRVNKAMAELAGQFDVNVAGRSDYDFFPREEADFFTSKDRAVLASGTMLDIPQETMHTPRGVRILHTKKIPVCDEQGNPRFLLGITRDITEEKRIEAEIREKNRQLETAVAAEREASAALMAAQARLVQSEKLAALGELVAGVAHEINNPLAFVTNNAAVLERDFSAIARVLQAYRAGDTAKAAQLSDEIDLAYTLENLPGLFARSKEGLRRIRQIVQDLREFSRQEALGDVQEDVDLNSGIRSTANIIQGRAKSLKVELQLDLVPLPPVPCQPAKINQVVLNLLSNALDACSAGGKITIATRPAAGGVQIQVSDTGAGVPPQIIDKIFDPFFTTKPPGKGTGLGLSISHGIITDHGGRVTVQSAPAGGACFTIWLPLTTPTKKANNG